MDHAACAKLRKISDSPWRFMSISLDSGLDWNGMEARDPEIHYENVAKVVKIQATEQDAAFNSAPHCILPVG